MGIFIRSRIKIPLMLRLFTLCILFFPSIPNHSQEPVWIWYPGDYEIWLHREVSLRRNEWGGILPPPWRLDSHYGSVVFFKEVSLDRAEPVGIRSTCQYSVRIDQRLLPDTTKVFTIPPGDHRIEIYAFDYDVLPAIYLRGVSIMSDSSWRVQKHYEEIRQVGTPAATGLSAFKGPSQDPLEFNFAYRLLEPVRMERRGNELLADFGRETFGFIQLLNISQPGQLTLYYGESEDEALDDVECQTYEILEIPADSLDRYTIPITKGLRFCRASPEDGMEIGGLQLRYEYLPVETIGDFECSDTLLNRIFDVSAYTLHLTSREFFLDGLKRDRWVWSGDAAQSELMDFYLFFDPDIVKRTLWGLRGKDPVETHINRIMDYSYYWFISIYHYYLYTGDEEFVKSIYPRMLTLMDYCLDRVNENGFVDERGNGWLFLDWAPIDKTGEISAFQILLARSLEAMATCAEIAGDPVHGSQYSRLAGELKKKTYETFWDPRRQVILHNLKHSRLSDTVTRYAAVFSLLFGYVDGEQAEALKNRTLKNDQVLKITTPYMRFYELAALCEVGEQEYVLGEIRDYWGGMLAQGATSFWEQYFPGERGADRYAMYGRPYGRSLCHSWGASPVYLLGKYYLGVGPTSSGYASFRVKPVLGGLRWMRGTVPVNQGKVELYMDGRDIQVRSSRKGGVLEVRSSRMPGSNRGSFSRTGEDRYELKLESTGFEYSVRYYR
jgi:alpha-L-rhamnosidase